MVYWFQSLKNVLARQPSPPAIAGAGASSSFFLSRWFFLRLLGVVYLAAFVSLWTQVDGLIGSQGVLPVGRFLDRVQQAYGSEACLWYPTLCWIDPGDSFLHVLCAGGVLLSCLLILGIVPGPVLFMLWACYLSLMVAGQVFLGYQWDTLLIETGLLAVFYAPFGIWPRLANEHPPSPASRFLLRWLLFRLMFGSGLAKLVSGDPSWHSLSALEYHYETQPLPTWTSWYLHQLPAWFQGFSVVLTFCMELMVPLLLFGPRRWRHLGSAAIAVFQLLIALSGNYGFFNFLTIVLCVAQLDDAFFPRFLLDRFSRDTDRPSPSSVPWRRLPVALIAGVIFVLTLVPFLANLGVTAFWPGWLLKSYRVTASFHSVNRYALFAVMTTERREIIIEGSNDGKTWRAYEFRWKPGDVKRAPSFTGLHLPRLDWQMWFAALGDLGDYRSNPWFEQLLGRLLEGSPEVLALLESNPFPDAPPRYVRALVYRYHFTDLASGSPSGAWWRREYLGLYSPVR
jgi:hypothetical protein